MNIIGYTIKTIIVRYIVSITIMNSNMNSIIFVMLLLKDYV